MKNTLGVCISFSPAKNPINKSDKLNTSFLFNLKNMHSRDVYVSLKETYKFVSKWRWRDVMYYVRAAELIYCNINQNFHEIKR